MDRRTTGIQSGKPPTGNWQATLPSWEKKFCTEASSIPWKHFLEAKQYVYLYEHILQWNDSAGEEAFHNAKNRFWAEVNGLPCETSVPGPDIYIQDIDWDSNIVPDLDLESDFPQPDGEQIVLIGGPFDKSHLYPSHDGWGDVEDDWNKPENKVNSWGQNGEVAAADGWGDVCDNSWGVNGSGGEVPKGNIQVCLDNNNWDCDESQNQNKMYQSWNFNEKNNFDGFWDSNNREVSNPSSYMSRYKTSRFHSGDQIADRESRNRRRYNETCKKPVQWKNSCGPVIRHGQANPRNRWSSDKPVFWNVVNN